MSEENKFSLALLAVTSQDAKIRNRAAIDLMDSGNPDAVAALVAAIEVRENREARGTLIYALSGFDCSSLFAPIFRWAIEGGFEATSEAISILREQSLRPNEVEREECLVLLNKGRNEVELNDDLLDELDSFLL